MIYFSPWIEGTITNVRDKSFKRIYYRRYPLNSKKYYLYINDMTNYYSGYTNCISDDLIAKYIRHTNFESKDLITVQNNMDAYLISQYPDNEIVLFSNIDDPKYQSLLLLK